MIAQAKSISHGINAIRYITGEACRKKHPELITYVKNTHLDDYIAASGIWDIMKHRTASHRHMKNNVFSIELSPAKENTEDFSIDDWANLWDDFVAAFDSIELQDKKGKVISEKTHLKDSMATVWLHEDAKSGIPHLHAIVSRVDENGNVSNDHNIHLRAQKAAAMIARSRGWSTAGDVHEEKTARLARECEDILRNMDSFDLMRFLEKLAEKYEVMIRRDKARKIHGYTVKQGNTIYKASVIGSGRHFTVSNLERTWWSLHPKKKVADTYEKPKQKQPIQSQTQTRTHAQTQTLTQTQNREQSQPQAQSRWYDGKDSHTGGQAQGGKPSEPTVTSTQEEESAPSVDYTERRDDTRAYDIPFDGRERRFYLPEEVADLFDEEFNYKEVRNWQDLTNTAVSIFVGMMLEAQVQVGSGGGGSSNDLPRRKKDEDDLDWARRCAKYARQRHGIERKSGLRR